MREAHRQPIPAKLCILYLTIANSALLKDETKCHIFSSELLPDSDIWYESGGCTQKVISGGLQCQCVLFMKTRMINIFWDFPNLKSELLSATLFLPFLGGELLKLRGGVQKIKWEKFTFVTSERAEISGWKLTRIHLRMNLDFHKEKSQSPFKTTFFFFWI